MGPESVVAMMREIAVLSEDEHPLADRQGGQLLQLAGSADLLVAWRETPSEDPGDVEASLISGRTGSSRSLVESDVDDR